MIASVVVPVWNDADGLRRLIGDLRADSALEIVVVDGGSEDGAAAIGCAEADVFVAGRRGRGQQLGLGAESARGDWLWFLHADSRISTAALTAFRAAANTPGWGWFAVRLASDRPALRVVEAAMNRRSRLTGIATGDQGIFVHRRLLDAAGGVPAQPLMEDIELCKRLRRLAKPRCQRTPIETSARRWERFGVARTVTTMWRLRLRYFLGADPIRLARLYYADDGADSRNQP